LEGATLVNLTLLHHQLGDQETAVAYGLRAISILQEVKEPHFQAWAHTWLAHALVALNQLDAGREHYNKALALRQALKQESTYLEPSAGLARIALARHELEQMRHYGEIIWQAMQKDPDLTDIHERVRVYLTGYYCLQAVQDGRALQLLTAGHNLLLKLADLITQSAQRQLFLEMIPAHREMLAVWDDVMNGIPI